MDAGVMRATVEITDEHTTGTGTRERGVTIELVMRLPGSDPQAHAAVIVERVTAAAQRALDREREVEIIDIAEARRREQAELNLARSSLRMVQLKRLSNQQIRDRAIIAQAFLDHDLPRDADEERIRVEAMAMVQAAEDLPDDD